MSRYELDFLRLCVKRMYLSVNIVGIAMKYLPIMAITGLMAGCSSLNSITDTTNLIDYSNHKSVKLLEVPADLDKPTFDNTYVTTASDDITANKPVSVDSVPLVDSAMTTAVTKTSPEGVVTTGALSIVKQGSQLVLKSSGDSSKLLKQTTDGLTSMGMTARDVNEATGVIQVRDRSEVASSESFIGSYLNKALGRKNEGAEYQVVVKSGTVAFTDLDGRALPEAEARSLLTRLNEEMSGS